MMFYNDKNYKKKIGQTTRHHRKLIKSARFKYIKSVFYKNKKIWGNASFNFT